MIFQWTRQGRRPTTLAGVIVPVLLGLGFWWVFDASWGIVALCALAALPALHDVLRNPQARLEVWPGRLVWSSVLRSGQSSDIQKVRLDRRFDGGLRITLIHSDMAHTRLPPDIAPPMDALVSALARAGISAEKHPFSPF